MYNTDVKAKPYLGGALLLRTEAIEVCKRTLDDDSLLGFVPCEGRIYCTIKWVNGI